MFQRFTGIQYLALDIANTFGLDKESFDSRLDWVRLHRAELESFAEEADEPMLFLKGVKALRDVEAGKLIGHNVFWDCTASGLQLMACLTGCEATALEVNIGTDERKDVYISVAKQINEECGFSFTRQDVKPALMTRYYNSILNPIETFGEDTDELKAFYTILGKSFKGAEEFMEDCNDIYQSYRKDVYSWTLPDGHVAVCPITVTKVTKLEIDELNHEKVAYTHSVNQWNKKDRSLPANIIHSIDGYVAREMVRMAREQGFELAHIHDAFTFLPNYGNQVRQNFLDILQGIAKSNLLGDIFNEIAGEDVGWERVGDISELIHKSNYALS